MLALGTIKLKGMDEKFNLLTGLTQSKVKHRYAGDIEAESCFECLTFSATAQSANFVGLEYLTGKIGNRRGGFILQHVGSIKSGKSESTLNVLSGSGTGELAGIKGHGRSTWSGINGQLSQVLLEYTFD
ncbi:DUF3224 domain-containing protein [Undibacterium sp. Rencai35W]|uniref:DUF3224 domain-containing protein n=1 Tax=Undibacterium sp. Rencai35W TaxID=3413046 RepID=UPI003BF373BA